MLLPLTRTLILSVFIFGATQPRHTREDAECNGRGHYFDCGRKRSQRLGWVGEEMKEVEQNHDDIGGVYDAHPNSRRRADLFSPKDDAEHYHPSENESYVCVVFPELQRSHIREIAGVDASPRVQQYEKRDDKPI